MNKKWVSTDSLIETLMRHKEWEDFPSFQREEFLKFALQFVTLAEVWDKCPRADWMLWILQQIGYRNDRALRLFAVFCAHQANQKADDARELAAIALRCACGEVSQEEMAEIRNRYRNAAIGAGTIGLKHATASAGRWLSAYHCTFGDPFHAALRASRSIVLWTAKDKQEKEAIEKAQAERLREIVANPFN